jgi:hypothetical protein
VYKNRETGKNQKRSSNVEECKKTREMVEKLGIGKRGRSKR